MSKSIARRFLDNIPTPQLVDKSTLRALKIYLNNTRRKPRKPIDADHEKLCDHAPFRLEEDIESDFLLKLEEKCFKLSVDGQLNPAEWRDTTFTRALGGKERRIMSDLLDRSLWLVEFRDEQNADSWGWEKFNRAGHERCDMVPVYQMKSKKHGTFNFIMRSWQRCHFSGKPMIEVVG